VQLREGPTTVEVRAVDTAGNVDPTPASHAFTVHVLPADTTIESGPRCVPVGTRSGGGYVGWQMIRTVRAPVG
jgi:hypothetical protein